MVDLISVIQYWRNSLADSSHPVVSEDDLKGQVPFVSVNQLALGQLDTQATKKIFDLNEDNLKRENIENTSHTQSTEVEIVFAPFALKLKPSHTVSDQTYDAQLLIPLWVPAVLSKDGALLVPEYFSAWIPREYLSPVEDAIAIIGSVDKLDTFLAAHIQPAENWVSYWQFAVTMLQEATTLNPSDLYLEEFEVTLPGRAYTLLCDPTPVAAKAMAIYDFLIKSGKRDEHYFDTYRYDLLSRYAALPRVDLAEMDGQTVRIPVPPQDQALFSTDQISRSKFHLAQMNGKFPLKPSQREALHYALALEHGDILAINGPPGTGKTTLLQSIVASIWVESALNKSGDFPAEPPVIVIASTNNQAVTNVLDGFSKVVQDNSPLGGRWLPLVEDRPISYGLYCASNAQQEKNDRKDKADSTKYQAINAKFSGFFTDIETKDFIAQARAIFLERFEQAFNTQAENIGHTAQIIQESLIELSQILRDGLDRYTLMADRVFRAEKYASRKEIESAAKHGNADARSDLASLAAMQRWIDMTCEKYNIPPTIPSPIMQHFGTYRAGE